MPESIDQTLKCENGTSEESENNDFENEEIIKNSLKNHENQSKCTNVNENDSDNNNSSSFITKNDNIMKNTNSNNNNNSKNNHNNINNNNDNNKSINNATTTTNINNNNNNNNINNDNKDNATTNCSINSNNKLNDKIEVENKEAEEKNHKKIEMTEEKSCDKSNMNNSGMTKNNIDEAEKYKIAGNNSFSNKKYDEAIKFYTLAINANPSNVSYFTNRSLAFYESEAYGGALEDADKAIALDSNNIKAHYRKAYANLALNRLSDAIDDFEFLHSKLPDNKEILNKLNMCMNQQISERYRLALTNNSTIKDIWQSLASIPKPDVPNHKNNDKTVKNNCDNDVNSNNANDIDNLNNNYNSGNNNNDDDNDDDHEDQNNVELVKNDDEIDFDNLDPNTIETVIRCFKEQKLIDVYYMAQLLILSIEKFKKLPNIVHVEAPCSGKNRKVTICGDVHGQFYDFLNIFELNGMPSDDNVYIFNGDFVDRGAFSLEIIITMLLMKLYKPNSIYLNRGNHENHSMNSLYGFEGEIKTKFQANNLGSDFYNAFKELFETLPICHIVGEKIFIVHGGVPSNGNVDLKQIESLNRFEQIPDQGIFCDLLWADPHESMGLLPSPRGISNLFGKDVTKRFLERNQLNVLVRSHEMKSEGYEIHQDGKCVTIFSAPNYCDTMGNKAAFISVNDDLTLKFTQFTHVPHPVSKYKNIYNQMLY